MIAPFSKRSSSATTRSSQTVTSPARRIGVAGGSSLFEWEFWQGRPSRLHDRLRYRRNDDAGPWQITRLAP